MLAILFQEKTKKMLVFPKNAEKNASIIEKGLIKRPIKCYTITFGIKTEYRKLLLVFGHH